MGGGGGFLRGTFFHVQLHLAHLRPQGLEGNDVRVAYFNLFLLGFYPRELLSEERTFSSPI